MCECSSSSEEKSRTSEEESSLCIETVTIADNADLQPPPFSLVQVQLSKSALDLIPTGESSTTTCSCSGEESKEAIEERVLGPCPADESSDEKIVSSDEDLKSCTCTNTCVTLESKPSAEINENHVEFEFTLAMIKPEAMMYRREIEREIINEGFSISQTRWLQLTPEQVSDFYLDNYELANLARLIAYMSSAPIVVMILSKINAIEEWKMLMGPETVSKARLYAPDSIRGKYGRKGDDMMNTVHGSDTRESADREIHFFFPDRITEPILRDEDAVVDHLCRELNAILSEGLVKCCEAKPEDPIIWLGKWLLKQIKSTATM